VARARRELLLRAHRYRLRREDLEDCYSQATLELVATARKGGPVLSRQHLGNVLEQRFLSRVHDRRRALAGRSPMQAALEAAMSLGGVGEQELEIVDARAELEKLAVLREELRRVEQVAWELTPDQRLVLACQVGLQLYRSGVRPIAEIVRDNPLAADYTHWGMPGPGRWVSIYASAGHVFIVIAGLRLDTARNGIDVGPNRGEDGPRWRILDHIPTWERWAVRHPPGL
jgi:hypothetical protein